MKKILGVVCVLIICPAWAQEVAIKDATDQVVGQVVDGFNTFFKDEVHGISTGQGTPDKAAFRFVLSAAGKLEHYDAVFFAQPNCDTSGIFWFATPENPLANNNFNAEGSRAMYENQEWSLAGTPSGPFMVQSGYVYFGGVCSNHTQTINTPNDYRQAGNVVRTYTAPFEVN